MSIQKKLRVLCLTTLGCKAEPWDNIWEDVKELVEAFGERRVIEYLLSPVVQAVSEAGRER